MKKQFYLLISDKWKPCDRATYLELKSNYKRIRLYNHIATKLTLRVNKNMVFRGIGLY